MNAFIGHSFEEKDSQTVTKIKEFIESTGINCQTGEKAQNKSVAEKVKERILDNDIFVAIFTCDKELASKKKFLRKTKKFYTTSNWVIQESGFAIGSEKELIFLVEKGIDKFPELQSDMEVIYFNKESLEEPFLKLNQMIDSIKEKKIPGVPSEKFEREEDLEKKEAEKEKEKVIDEIKDRKEAAFKKVYNAIFEEEDYNKTQEIFYKELQPSLSDDKEKRLWEAIVLRYSHKLGDTEAFDKLEKHVEKYKNDPALNLQLAFRYKEMREYQKAKEKFLVIKEIYDINKTEDIEDIITCYEEAGICLALDNKYNDAIELLSKPLNEDVFKEHKAWILSVLARIAKMSKDSEKLFIYGENSLELDPSNTKLRFDLAYEHSKKGNNKLSLLHYIKLTDTKKSPVGLNNLGVQYKTLQLPAKSVESYFKAAEYKETLAMANIAQNYLDEGFIKDANGMIKKANKLSEEGVEVSGNIGFAKNRLDEILEHENNKEKETLSEAEKEREFRIKYSEAYYSRIDINKEKFDGIWQTPWGNLKLILDESKSTFKGEEKIKLKLLGHEGWIKMKTEPKEEHYKNRFISIEGDLEKLSGRYKIKIEEVIDYKYIPSDKKIVHEAEGYLEINKDYNLINVMEKSTKEELNISSWKKKISKES